MDAQAQLEQLQEFKKDLMSINKGGVSSKEILKQIKKTFEVNEEAEKTLENILQSLPSKKSDDMKGSQTKIKSFVSKAKKLKLITDDEVQKSSWKRDENGRLVEENGEPVREIVSLPNKDVYDLILKRTKNKIQTTKARHIK